MTCRCDENTIDYSTITDGRLRCRECGRVWVLLPSGWDPRPMTKYAPRRR